MLSLFLLAGAILSAPGTSSAEPPAVPSGMDLLYSDRVPLEPSGEPLITLGLMSGQERIVVRADTAMQADFYEAGVLKRSTIRAGDAVMVSVVRAQPARREYYVNLEGVPRGRSARLDEELSRWRKRGYARVRAIEDGTVLGIGGRVIDNRELRVVLPVASRKQAAARVSEIYDRFGDRAFTSARLAERPWGELAVQSGGAPLGKATSFVRFTGLGGPIQVDSVEHDRGYAWHGAEDRLYRGEIYVVVDPDGRLAAVNVLGAEEVLAGVVPSEIFASSPPAALEAQAVAARTQLFVKLGKRHHDDPFHLCSEQHCQVYGGISKEDPRTTAAVRATAGEVVFLHGELVDTVYSSSCGGFTEDNDAVWGNTPDPGLRGRPDFDVTAHPELARFAHGFDEHLLREWLTSRPLTYCATASKARPEKFRWKRRLTARELAADLAGRFDGIGTLRHVVVEQRGRGGKVVSLRLVGDEGSAVLLHELPIRQLFGNLSSGSFVIDEEHDARGNLVAVTFTGGGWGHGVGMCQMGAIGRAEAGQSYRQILAHYYNGATVERLYLPADEPRAAQRGASSPAREPGG